MSAMSRLKTQSVLIAEESRDLLKKGISSIGIVELMRFPLIAKWDV